MGISPAGSELCLNGRPVRAKILVTQGGRCGANTRNLQGIPK